MAPEIIGRYQTIAEVGKGGMATVYRGYDPVFERDIAIKILPSSLLHDPQFRIRFEREAKMIASLEHPAIVPVYDFGEQDEQPYIIMRYMAGGSLADRLTQGPISAEETIRIIVRLAPALDAAHAKGIIHRDLKPGNILFDQYGNAFLSDFGIARQAQTGEATITGEIILGTPSYMSPKQIQGNKSIDGRSDIYALGVLIFQMLTGQVPYHADTPAKVMMMHILEPVPDIKTVKSDIPYGCETVISQAMAKNPDDRFANVFEMASKLEGSTLANFSTSISGAFADGNSPKLPQFHSAETVVKAPITQPFPEKVPTNEISVENKSKKLTRSLIITFCIVLFLFFIAAIVFSTLRIFIKSPQMVFQPTIAQAFPSSQIPIINWTPTFAPKSTTQIPILMISPTNTLTPTNSIFPTASRITIPVVGGADKIAYLNGNDILVANLDGNEMVKLTDDGAQKSDLRWVPGGQGLTYVQGKCVQYVELESGRIDNITCFNFVDYLRSFAISPDNQLAAISLDNQLYIVPYDVSKLNKVQTRGGLTSIADCKDFAPFETNYVKTLNWSKDGKELAAVVIGVSGTGFRADIIRIFDVSTCTPTPQVLDHFPTAARLQMKDYDKNPEIQNFGWDGLYLFALNTSFRNDGFGDLYVYNMDLHKGTQALNPINNSCCYRDPHWSPDGSYLLFAYQNMLKGPQSITELYYIQFGTLGTGLIYDPLPLSPINDPRGKPIPVLRPAP